MALTPHSDHRSGEMSLALYVAQTPTNELRSVYKYFCPICMMYFRYIYKTACCKNYICEYCSISLIQGKERQHANHMMGPPKTPPKLSCPFCCTDGLSLLLVSSSEEVRKYMDTPTARPHDAFSTVPPSPVRVGDTFEDLKRKMVSFEQAGYRKKAPKKKKQVKKLLERAKSAPPFRLGLQMNQVLPSPTQAALIPIPALPLETSTPHHEDELGLPPLVPRRRMSDASGQVRRLDFETNSDRGPASAERMGEENENEGTGESDGLSPETGLAENSLTDSPASAPDQLDSDRPSRPTRLSFLDHSRSSSEQSTLARPLPPHLEDEIALPPLINRRRPISAPAHSQAHVESVRRFAEPDPESDSEESQNSSRPPSASLEPPRSQPSSVVRVEMTGSGSPIPPEGSSAGESSGESRGKRKASCCTIL